MSVLTAASALDGVLEQVTAGLVAARIPGLELAVVRGGEPVFVGGLGVRGAGDPAPVTATTVFHHGSCGKAYTGLLAAVLAEEQLVDLDAPVRRYVPELRLPDTVVAERVTTHDLLSHRSGLGRHDLAWVLNPDWSPAETLRRLEHLPLVGDLRGQWSYSNFGFALAGLVLERAAGADFHTLLRQRVLDPLGMTRTFTTVAATEGDADVATPHLLRHDAAVPTPWRVIDGVAPAGQLLSCAQDSVHWLLAQLGTGAVSAAAVRAAQHPQMVVPAASSPFPELTFVAYASGWLIGTYRGRPVVWHNGGIDGFSTQTLLLPDQQIGVVASANLHGTNTPLGVVLTVVDALLEESRSDRSWLDLLRTPTTEVPEQAAPTAPESGPGPAHPLADYAGSYTHPGFGSVTVTAAGGRLEVTIGAFDVDATHRHYDVWNVRYDPLDADGTLSFITAPDGTVGAAELELEPGGVPVRFARRAAQPS